MVQTLLRSLLCIEFLLTWTSSEGTEQQKPISTHVEDSVAAQIAEQYPMAVSISRDGSRILVKTNEWGTEKLSVIDRATRRVVGETKSPNAHLALSWSPNRNEIAYLSADGNGDKYHLFLW